MGLVFLVPSRFLAHLDAHGGNLVVGQCSLPFSRSAKVPFKKRTFLLNSSIPDIGK